MAWWMRDFYWLRNSIVHGDAIDLEQLYFSRPDDNSDGITHMQVAVIVMGECIWRLLFSEKIVGDNCRRRAEVVKNSGCSELLDEIAKLYALDDAGTRAVHKHLGWLIESRISQVEQVRILFNGRQFSDSSDLIREDRER